jgi:hypothetical protein
MEPNAEIFWKVPGRLGAGNIVDATASRVYQVLTQICLNRSKIEIENFIKSNANCILVYYKFYRRMINFRTKVIILNSKLNKVFFSCRQPHQGVNKGEESSLHIWHEDKDQGI